MHLQEFLLLGMAVFIFYVAFGGAKTLLIKASENIKGEHLNVMVPLSYTEFIDEMKLDFQNIFNFVLYDVAKNGGIEKPEKILQRVYTEIKTLILQRKFSGEPGINLFPSIEDFASAQGSYVNISTKAYIVASTLKAKKEIWKDFYSPFRFGYLYEKAVLFYQIAFENKSVFCISWDGNGGITLKGISPGDKKIHAEIYWNTFYGVCKNEINGKCESFSKGDNNYQKFSCILDNENTCSVKIGLFFNNITIYKKEMNDGYFPLLFFRGKPMEICVNIKEYLPSIIRENIDKDHGLLPRRVTGRTYCDGEDSACGTTEFLGPYEALKKRIGCQGSLYSCIKQRLKNRISNIVKKYIENESDGETEWKFTLEIPYLNIMVIDDNTCSWIECCAGCGCAPCNSGGGGEGGDSAAGINSEIVSRTIEFLPTTLYKKENFLWKFQYTSPKEIAHEAKARGVNCPGNCDISECCKCPQGCPCGVSPCCPETLWMWEYTYRYIYSYKIKITIVDKRSIGKVIIAVG